MRLESLSEHRPKAALESFVPVDLVWSASSDESRDESLPVEATLPEGFSCPSYSSLANQRSRMIFEAVVV